MARKQEVKSVEQKLETAMRDLEDDIRRWNDIYENGCSDPFWPDGVNLDLKRNHIINDLRRIADLERKPRQMSMFCLLTDPDSGVLSDILSDPRIPPKVPMDYMAHERKCYYFDARKQEVSV